MYRIFLSDGTWYADEIPNDGIAEFSEEDGNDADDFINDYSFVSFAYELDEFAEAMGIDPEKIEVCDQD